ncbi:B12-binding domain-containing radical SAM protein [Streptomyces sp. NPDC048603]|uniref:B12-binding domain-containing radical SAM protein n=1 Tax=Streptomyces sp. NPDC048603 TaxID=3365577 RepID=UPI00371B8EE5
MIGLVFPPLAESNFGSFYPSTAVLAGFLRHRGVEVWQRDMNEDFAEFLLSPTELEPLAAGRVPGVPGDSYTASAARWALRRPGRLLAGDGRHLFGAGRYTGRIVETLAAPFRIDTDGAPPSRAAVERAGSGIFGRFYDRYPGGTDAGAGGRPVVPERTALVGVSVPMGPQLVPALLLALRLKAERPDLRVVLGGPCLSLMPLHLLETLLTDFPEVDAVVRFDGEFPLLALSRQAEAGRWEPELVAGASCLLPDGTPHTRDPAPGPGLNTLPLPVFPAEAMARLSDPVLGVTQARGCYRNSTCDHRGAVGLYGGSAPFRGRHPDRFVDELEHLAEEHGTRRFSFVTESIPPAFARRMSGLLIERGADITWSSSVTADRRFDRELLSLMAESGCEFLSIGMETTGTRPPGPARGSAAREKSRRFLREAHAAGVGLVISLVPDLPSTTYEEALRVLADVEQVADCVRAVSVLPFRAGRAGRADPAMSPEQRAEVHRRYAAFADRINGTSGAPPRGVPVTPDAVLRIPVEEFDLYVAGADGTVADADGGHGTAGPLRAVNLRTRERITLPPAARARLGHLLDGRPFTRRELASVHGERITDGLLDDLGRSGLLAEAGLGRGAP